MGIMARHRVPALLLASSLTLLAACSLLPTRTPLVTPGPAASGTPASSLHTFDAGGLTFAYPADWREFHYDVRSTMSSSIAFLATVPVPEPCRSTTGGAGLTGTECKDRFQLTADSLVVSISTVGMPGFDITRLPAGATALRIDGQPAYVQEFTPEEPSVGADQEWIWTMSLPAAPGDAYTIVALIRGPDLAPIKTQLDALVASLRYDPPASPPNSFSTGGSATP